MNVPAKTADLQADADERLFDLMEQMTEQVQLGEEVDIAAYIRQYPQYAEQLQKMALTLEVLRTMKPGGGFIASPSHDYLLPETPVENVIVMYQTIREHGAY